MANRTALILGCNGQDGSLISQSLLSKGYRVIGISKTQKQRKSNLQKLGIEKDVELIFRDMTELNFFIKIIDQYSPDEIYNLASQSSVGLSFSQPITAIESIILITIKLLEACREISYTGRVFFAGSSEIFGNTEQGADIQHLQNPQSPYAIAKQTSFNLVKMYREIFSLKCMSGVLFNHESNLRSDVFVTQKIIKAAKKISKDKSIKLRLGNIDVIRDWGWAPEYIEAMQIITNSTNINDHVICTGEAHTLKDYISKVFSFFELEWQDHVVLDKKLFRSNEILKSYGNPEPLLNELGWKAKISFSMVVNNMISGSIATKI